jgi:hypothetical protein
MLRTRTSALRSRPTNAKFQSRTHLPRMAKEVFRPLRAFRASNRIWTHCPCRTCHSETVRPQYQTNARDIQQLHGLNPRNRSCRTTNTGNDHGSLPKQTFGETDYTSHASIGCAVSQPIKALVESNTNDLSIYQDTNINRIAIAITQALGSPGLEALLATIKVPNAGSLVKIPKFRRKKVTKITDPYLVHADKVALNAGGETSQKRPPMTEL